MKWLADENIPTASIALLRQAGLDVTSVREIQPGLADHAVLGMAHGERRGVLTFDRDFGELVFQQQLPCPPAVIYLRFAPVSPEEPGHIVLAMLESVGVLDGQFIVLDRESYRKRALPD